MFAEFQHPSGQLCMEMMHSYLIRLQKLSNNSLRLHNGPAKKTNAISLVAFCDGGVAGWLCLMVVMKEKQRLSNFMD